MSNAFFLPWDYCGTFLSLILIHRRWLETLCLVTGLAQWAGTRIRSGSRIRRVPGSILGTAESDVLSYFCWCLLNMLGYIFWYFFSDISGDVWDTCSDICGTFSDMFGTCFWILFGISGGITGKKKTEMSEQMSKTYPSMSEKKVRNISENMSQTSPKMSEKNVRTRTPSISKHIQKSWKYDNKSLSVAPGIEPGTLRIQLPDRIRVPAHWANPIARKRVSRDLLCIKTRNTNAPQ